MKILLTGGTGLLGKALIETADSAYEMIATFLGDYGMEDTNQVRFKNLDIRDKESYFNLFHDFRPEVVIHTAGIGSPDFAEKNKKEAWMLNVGGIKNIVEQCEQFDAKLIYVSSNGIYDGFRAPYSEEDKAEPINYYGQIKLEGEKITKDAKVTWAIVRPILMYGRNCPFERPNIVSLALSNLRGNKEFFVFDDVYSNPLYAQNCAGAIWKIIAEGKFDIFNIGGKDRVSIYELVKKAAEIFNFDSSLVKPIKQGFFRDFVKRPPDTTYDTSKMRKDLKIEPLSVSQGLMLMKNSEGI